MVTLHLNHQITVLQALSLFFPEVQAFPRSPSPSTPGNPQECCAPPVCCAHVSSVSLSASSLPGCFLYPSPACKGGELECGCVSPAGIHSRYGYFQSLLLEDAPLLQTQRDPLSQRWLHSPTWECQGRIVPPSPEVLRED